MLPTSTYRNKNFTEPTKEYKDLNDQAILLFGGLFDGSAYGRYLFGDDPRNNRGVSWLRSNNDLTGLDIRNMLLRSRNGRDFPYIYDSKLKIDLPLYSLHIHSKKLALFRTGKSEKLIKKASLEYKSKVKKTFSLNIFLKSIKISLMRRALLVNILKKNKI